MPTIAGFEAVAERFREGAVELVCHRVADLERIVDRDALLRADAVPEPPYWAHLWIGATALARHVATDPQPFEGLAVLDLGCGVGLPGLVAAALEFVRASLAENRLEGCRTFTVDFTREPPPRRYDRILGAEIVYEPATYAPLAAYLDAALAPGGELLLTDAFRSDAATFFAELERRGFRGTRLPRREWEGGRPQGLFLWVFRR
jgi:predicted nicotinamide N-methyase